jgi:cell division septation protein DedD
MDFKMKPRLQEHAIRTTQKRRVIASIATQRARARSRHRILKEERERDCRERNKYEGQGHLHSSRHRSLAPLPCRSLCSGWQLLRPPPPRSRDGRRRHSLPMEDAGRASAPAAVTVTVSVSAAPAPPPPSATTTAAADTSSPDPSVLYEG